MTEPGLPSFLYWSAPPRSPCLTVSWAFAAVEPRFDAVTVQCVADGALFVDAGKLVGLHVLASVTVPCVFTNATGIVTLLPPFRGTRLIRPSYWPFATVGASISIGKVTLSPLPTWIALPPLTVIVTPAGAVTFASSVWFTPETLIAVRCVVIEPDM